MGHYVIL